MSRNYSINNNSTIIIICFQPISYGPKSKRPIIEVYHKMTVKALARAMDINVGRFFFE